MILTVTGELAGEISVTYCQNLCLIFFPGSKFPADKEKNTDCRTVAFDLYERDGKVVCDVTSTIEVQGDGTDTEVEASKRTYTGHGETVPEAFADRSSAVKTAAGDAMIEAGTAEKKVPPPWGTLTGVRPASLFTFGGDHGHTSSTQEASNNELYRYGECDEMIKRYHIQPEKAKLLREVIRSREEARRFVTSDTCSLYISVPFCPTRCAYCSFVSYSTPRYLSMIPDYLDRLCEDIAQVCRRISEDGKKILTVYVGGGTPTVLDAKQLDRLLGTVRKSMTGDPMEFTVEAGRPDTVTAEKFDVMLSHGVDRTSINPQILDDGILRNIGRRHTVRDFFDAYEIAKRSGIKSINTDLIAGLPGSNFEIFGNTVKMISEISPDNVTVHTFCVKRSAQLREDAVLNGDQLGIYSYSGGDTAQCVEYAIEELTSDGKYHPYYLYRQKNARGNLENIGYAKDGRDGLYNIFSMENLHDIYAVGAGAVTKLIDKKDGRDKITRIFEAKYTYEYLKDH